MTAQPLDPTQMQRIARFHAAPATCFAAVRLDMGYDVRCYSASGEIRCCGHGLLATAHVLHSRQSGGHDTGTQPLGIYQPEAREPLRVKWEEGATWLRLPRLHCRPVQVPGWATEALGIKPRKAAIAGGDEGYLVLELEDSAPLAELDVRHLAISKNTRRAVIVSQQSIAKCGTCKNYDFFLRYFAPQYGINEDRVTGSANRVLADYWAQRTGANHFRALQCSAEGGVVMACTEGDYVWLGGRVRFI